MGRKFYIFDLTYARLEYIFIYHYYIDHTWIVSMLIMIVWCRFKPCPATTSAAIAEILEGVL